MKDFSIKKSSIFYVSISKSNIFGFEWTFLRISHNGLTLFTVNNITNQSIFGGMDLQRIKIDTDYNYKLKIIGMDDI